MIIERGETMVKNAIVVDANEIKRILAEKYQVPEANVIKSQYSYTIIMDEGKTEGEHN